MGHGRPQSCARDDVARPRILGTAARLQNGDGPSARACRRLVTVPPPQGPARRTHSPWHAYLHLYVAAAPQRCADQACSRIWPPICTAESYVDSGPAAPGAASGSQPCGLAQMNDELSPAPRPQGAYIWPRPA